MYQQYGRFISQPGTRDRPLTMESIFGPSRSRITPSVPGAIIIPPAGNLGTRSIRITTPKTPL